LIRVKERRTALLHLRDSGDAAMRKETEEVYR